MKRIILETESGRCKISVGESIGNLPKYAEPGKTIIITDGNVRKIYWDKLEEFEVIEIGAGEGSKTIQTVNDIYERFLEMELTRDSVVVGVGGGIVTDVAGFAAATYLRGVRTGFVPTTLLAQVDAAIGGKNGVNLRGYKNLIGTIRQPEFVLCDPAVLRSLPEEGLRCGFAEVIKHALISNSSLFERLERNVKSALALEKEVVESIIVDSINVKAEIVRRDEKESGERMKLNLGHTFAHGLEKIEGVSHGEAVGIGLALASELSVKKGLLAESECERVKALLEAFGLPVKRELKLEQMIDAIRKDKKRRGDEIKMILLEEIGKVRIQGVGLDEIKSALKDLC